MLTNTFGLFTGVDTVDERKGGAAEANILSRDLRVFPENISMTQPFFLDLGNDSDRLIFTIGGNRILAVHACTQFCLNLVNNFKGNIVTVSKSGGGGYSVWTSQYTPELFEQVTQFLLDNPSSENEEDEFFDPADDFLVDSEGRRVSWPASREDSEDESFIDVEGDPVTTYASRTAARKDKPGLWQRFTGWVAELFRDDDDEDDDYDDDDYVDDDPQDDNYSSDDDD